MRYEAGVFPPSPDDVGGVVERTFRAEYGRVVATLIRLLGGDFDAAEEAVADAFVAALQAWPRDGIPARPAAWLTTAARNKALDRLRADRRRADRRASLERALSDEHPEADMRVGSDSSIADDRLRLIFTCCHPALPIEARVALTLRTLGGLSTAEIARAFLVPEATLAQRLVRAKRKIQTAGIPFRVPPDELIAERLDGVLATIYLVFNEGYSSSAGDAVVRADLSAEAIRLGRLVVELLPAPEALALLALMLLQDSRRLARIGPDGALALLENQDRGLWDRGEIAEGLEILRRAAAAEPNPYLLQASIAAEHARTVDGGVADWPEIARLYRELARLAPSPVVELNAAVATARADGPEAGLRAVDRIVAGGQLDRYHLLHSTRAELLRSLGRRAEARAAYGRALDLATNGVERAFLERRIAGLDETAEPPHAG